MAKKTAKKKPAKKVVSKPVAKVKKAAKKAVKATKKVVKKVVKKAAKKVAPKKAVTKKAAPKKVVGRFDQSRNAVSKLVMDSVAAVSKLVNQEKRAVKRTVKRVIKTVSESPIFAPPPALVTVPTLFEIPPGGVAAGMVPAPSPIEPAVPEEESGHGEHHLPPEEGPH